MTEQSASPAGSNNDPLDIATMRATVAALLADGAPYPRHDELDDQRLLLRGHLALIVPEVETLAAALPASDPLRAAALAAVTSARLGLAASPGHGLASATAHARGLARALRALCDHHRALCARPAPAP